MATTLILTPGDPTGIGPEITVKTLRRIGEVPALHFTIVGSIKALEESAQALSISLPRNIDYHDIPVDLPGKVAHRALDVAVQLLAAKKADALVTGPISKRNLKTAGLHMQGHTEILEEFAARYFPGAPAKAEMLFVFNKLRLMLLTRHIPLNEVAGALANAEAVKKSFGILIDFLKTKCGIDTPLLAVLGVNPHAGEVGGREESDVLVPLIGAINQSGAAKCDGPLAADGFFRSVSATEPAYDAIVATYHDQGLIPFKMLAGYEAVNVTIGLPFVRTSVSHGTGDDIAGKGIAREDSLMAAIRMAAELAGVA